MQTFEYTVKDALGIHARPAGLLVKEAMACSSDITVACKGKSASLKKLFAVMGLAVKCGDTVTVSVSGENEAADAATISKFLEANL